MDAASRIQAYAASLARFDRWVEEHLQSDGRWRQPASADGYFSLVPYANAIGRSEWALAALRHVQRTFIDSDGSLSQESNRDAMVPYVPAWIAWGAWQSEVLGLSASLLDQVCSYQCPHTGGFFGSTEGRETGAGWIDFDSTTIGTIVLARCGRVEASVRAADFLLRLYESQEELDHGFCTSWRAPGGLTSAGIPPTATLSWAEPKQHYYRAGLFVLALTYVHGATADPQYRDCAIALYDRVVTHAADLWTNTLSHKMCWAATLLYSATGQAHYLGQACRFADHLVTLQQANGAFGYPELWPQFPPDPWDKIPNIGPQFALWIARALGRMRAL